MTEHSIKSQNKMILAHMKRGAAITPGDALREFGCFRLAARIHELRGAGHIIQSQRIKVGDKHVSEYWMGGE